MGDVWIPDWAFTIDELLIALAILEEDWNSHSAQADVLFPVALTGMLIVAGVGAGLQGEEMPQIDIGGLWKHWSEGTEHLWTEHACSFGLERMYQADGWQKIVFPTISHHIKVRNTVPQVDSSSYWHI